MSATEAPESTFTILLRWRAAIVLSLFAAMLAMVGPRHEPWFDEGQAWLLGRDTTLWDLLAHRVRYEGSPGLWHAILWLLSHGGLPFSYLWTVSAAFACGGAWIILTRAPFPFFLRVGIIFSYFVAYQYAVVARSYALDLLLIPLIGACFASRLRRPVLYGVLLGLLANSNAYSFIIACAFAAEFLLARWRAGGWQRADFAGGALYLVLAAAAVLQAWPPSDAAFASNADKAPEIMRGAMLLAEAFVDRLDIGSTTAPGGTMFLLGFVASVLLLLPSLLLLLRARVALLAGLAFAGLLAFSILKFANAWHAGLLYLLWILALWIGWAALDSFSTAQRGIVVASVSLIVAVNVLYGAAATLRDIREPYSAGPAAAQAIAAVDGGGVAAAGFKTFAVQPWFPANAFANYQGGAAEPAYYTWRAGETFKAFVTLDRWRAIAAGRYTGLLLSLDGMSDDEIGQHVIAAREAGFCKAVQIPGGLIWKSYVRESDAMLLFTRCARSNPGRRGKPATQ